MNQIAVLAEPVSPFDPVALNAAATVTHDETLLCILASVLALGGFAAVVESCQRAQKRLARAYPDIAFRDGWIV